MPKLRFKGRDVLEVEEGTTVLEAALEHGVPIYHTCGGNASCSTCRVRVLHGAGHLSGIEAAEEQVLDSFDLKPPYRLGCQAQVTGGDVEVEIPAWERAPRADKIPPVPPS